MAFDSRSVGLVDPSGTSAAHARHDSRDTLAPAEQRLLFKFGWGAPGQVAIATGAVDAACRQGRIRRVDRVVDTRRPRVYEGVDEQFASLKRVVGRS
jgi:hypothetical protein